MAFLGIHTGIFKTSSGQPTKFAKSFVSPNGSPSTFTKVLNTVLTVSDFIPVIGEVSMGVQAGVLGATKLASVAAKDAAKIAAKEAVKVVGKEAVKISAKNAISTALRTAAKFGVKQGSTIVSGLTALSSQAVSSAPVVAAKQYDFSTPPVKLGQAVQKEPTKEISIFQWIEDFINSLFK